MDDRFTPRPIAGWFVAGAVASLIVMGLGCVALGLHLTTDPRTLPLDERVLFEAEPDWVLAASAVGFIAGLVGSILLLLKRRQAERVLLVSLLAILLWLVGIFITPGFRNLLSTDQVAILIVTAAVTWTIYWFARHSRQRGWLS
jgi:hypothetical protein